MKKLLLIICCLLVLPVHAASWVQISDNEYIDADSVQNYVDDHGYTNNSQKSYWSKTINNGTDEFFQQEEKRTGKKVSYSKNLEIIDNNRKTITLKSINLYDADDELISSLTNKDIRLEWNRIIPETVGELYSKLVNNPKLLKKIYKEQNIR